MDFSHFLTSLGLMWAYGISASVMLILILKIIDWCTPKIDIQKELIDNKNMAIAVPVAALILSITAIVVAVITH